MALEQGYVPRGTSRASAAAAELSLGRARRRSTSPDVESLLYKLSRRDFVEKGQSTGACVMIRRRNAYGADEGCESPFP